MTSTENPTINPDFQIVRYYTNGRKVNCVVCGEHRPMAKGMGPDYSDMCAACLTFAESHENVHSDEGHDRGFGTEGMAACAICNGHTEDTFAAAYFARTRKATAPTGATQAASTVTKDGTHKCGTCHADLPATKFPTKKVGTEYVRDTTTCRACKKAGK